MLSKVDTTLRPRAHHRISYRSYENVWLPHTQNTGSLLSNAQNLTLLLIHSLPLETDLKNDCELKFLLHRAFVRIIVHTKVLLSPIQRTRVVSLKWSKRRSATNQIPTSSDGLDKCLQLYDIMTSSIWWYHTSYEKS